MSKKLNKAGIAMAVAAAGLFAAATGTVVTAQEAPQVQCMGVNACKGQNACKTAANACKGQAACKGQGFLMMSAPDCAEQGGTVAKPQSM